ncbi:MAG: glycosyltransferase, partial [Cyanobacteriota bacterium]|nr:glycosyltransferase [Cyanobacteriota bacterium]
MHLPKTSRPHYHLIFPNIFGFKGGIQVYSAFLLEALQKLTPEAHYDVFLKYDRPNRFNSPFLPHTQFHCFGQFPRWLQNLFLALKILFLGIWQRPHLVVTTHVNYGIACYVLQRLT